MSNKDSNSSKIGEYLKQLIMTTIGIDQQYKIKQVI